MMDASYLTSMNGYQLVWALGILAPWIALGLGWIHFRRNRVKQLLTQAEVARIGRDLKAKEGQTKSLSNVITRHLAQSLEHRRRFRQLRHRLDNLELQICHADAYRRAIGAARRGGALEPLIKRGDVNPAEAHLIQVVHGSRRNHAAVQESSTASRRSAAASS